MRRTDLDGRDRRALLATAGQFFANGAMTASYVARAPQLRDQVGVALDEFGLLLTAAASGGLLASLLAGRIVAVATTRRVLRVGAVVMLSTLPLVGAARTPWVLLAALLVYAFVDVLVDISMNLQGSWISARRHTPVMSRLHGTWSLGTLAGGLGAVAANAAGVPPLTHLLVVTAVMAGVLLLVASNLLDRDEVGHADAVPRPPAPTGRTRHPAAPVVLLVLAGVFATVAELTAGDWATFRLTDDLGAPAALGSTAFVAFTVGMTLVRFAGDLLQVRLGRRGLRRASTLLAATGFLTASLVPVVLVSLVGFLLVGIGVATFMPSLYDDAARLPGRQGAGLGAMTAGMRVASLATPVAVGWLAATGLSVGAAIAVCTLPAVLCLAVVGEGNERLLPPRAPGGAGRRAGRWRRSGGR